MEEIIISYEYYTQIKGNVIENALNHTGATFNWSTVSQNSIITAAQILEIQNAVDVAHNAINTGCSSRNSSYQGSNNSEHCGAHKGPGNVTYNGSNCSSRYITVTQDTTH